MLNCHPRACVCVIMAGCVPEREVSQLSLFVGVISVGVGDSILPFITMAACMQVV